MGRYFALTLNLPVQVKSKPQSASRWKTNWKLVLVVLVVLVGIAYLFQVNDTATKGYEIKVIERRLAELREGVKRLELEAAALKSIQTIEQEVEFLNLIPSISVSYND